jgi:TonB family protein
MRRTAILVSLLCLWTVSAAARQTYCVERTTGAGMGDGGATRKDEGLPAYRARELDRRAIITFKPEPGYTEEAKQNNVEGVVRLKAVLCPAGKVLDISVVEGLPDGLTEEAIKAARGIRFRPAERKGKPVAQLVTLEYYFRPH